VPGASTQARCARARLRGWSTRAWCAPRVLSLPCCRLRSNGGMLMLTWRVSLNAGRLRTLGETSLRGCVSVRRQRDVLGQPRAAL
jgi:hypothetical protein